MKRIGAPFDIECKIGCEGAGRTLPPHRLARRSWLFTGSYRREAGAAPFNLQPAVTARVGRVHSADNNADANSGFYGLPIPLSA